MAQPTAVVFDPAGKFMYVAAFGTDRVAVVDNNGNVLARIEVSGLSGSQAAVDPTNKRGPRGLALNASSQKLYVLNRISNTISVVDTSRQVVTSEFAVGTDPTPAAIRQGRGFLYDAKLSGYGVGACSSCHVDGDMDHLAWDLGDPTGTVQIVLESGKLLAMHPMKGPMATQTLRGLNGLAPYHWRGDRADFAAFNSAFDSLLGGAQISSANMTAFTNFINTLLFPPNPYQNLDRTIPVQVQGLNAAAGQTTFLNAFLMLPEHATCNSCHVANPGPGTNLFVQNAIDNVVNDDQPLKVPELRNLYQKLLFNRAGPESIDGFGLDHEGDVSTLREFLSAGSFANYSDTQKKQIGAYLLCFDTGTAPAVGHTRTMNAQNVASATSDWNLLESQAAIGNIDLTATGTFDGKVHELLYLGSIYVATDSSGIAPLSHSQLKSKILAGGTVSIMGVYPGTGATLRSNVAPGGP